jgi:pimeloyl-ACP methyl ester carboxylesterase
MSKDEGGWNSSFSEKPVRSRLRRLVDWINLTGAKKVHSLIDKVYKRKNLEMAWEKVKENRGSGGVDLRAHGESDGRFMTPGYLEALDILGAVEEAKRHGAQRPFIAFGHSYGAVASLWAAARSPEIAAVVADGAFLTPEDVTVHGAQIAIRDPNSSFWEKVGMRLVARLVESPASLRFAYWAMYLRTGVHVTPGVANSLRAIAQMGPRPLLFIAGEKDGIALPEGASKMYEAAASVKKALWIVPGAGHGSTYRYKDKESAPLYEDHVLKFLTSAFLAKDRRIGEQRRTHLDRQAQDRCHRLASRVLRALVSLFVYSKVKTEKMIRTIRAGKPMKSLICIALCLPPFAAVSAGDSSPELLMDEGHWKQARAVVERLATTNGDHAQTVYLRSRLSLAFKDYDRALMLAENAVALDDRDARYHWQLGRVCGETTGLDSMGPLPDTAFRSANGVGIATSNDFGVDPRGLLPCCLRFAPTSCPVNGKTRY